MASSSSMLSNRTIARLYSTSKHEKGGDDKKGLHIKEAIKFALGKCDKSKWRTVNAVKCGIDFSMIPRPSLTVLNILRRKGHRCYFVGGCVRDLLLKRVPKDFDVITTANLKEIKTQFHRCVIVGQRFPVCVVKIGGQDIDVSSFDTVANGGSMAKSNNIPMLKSCTKTDVLRWSNSMHRDFTVNSLFLDPHSAKVYDYNGGMTDLKSLELRTLIPAHLSFQEDCARILRGLRIAARLNMSVSNDTATAIHRLSSSVLTLTKSRIMMEINYMLSYGAAQPSLCLLEQFNLLKVFFPCHAAILDQQTNEGCTLSSTMLMKLFSNLDNMVACDRPAHCSLWVSLMAFHLALNTKPQDPLVIWTFASLLCDKNWSRSVELARESVQRAAFSAPEISKSVDHFGDEELASKISELASLVATSLYSLTTERSLHESISRFKAAPSSVLVFVPEKCGRETAGLLSMFDADVKSYTTDKKKDHVDYKALKKGEARETRFVLGQIIMDTMSGKVNKACANSKPSQDMFCEGKVHTEKLVESVEIVDCTTYPQNVDEYFLEKLGPTGTLGKSEELITVAKTDIKENIAKQKQSGAHERSSKQEGNHSSQKNAADKVVQQKMINVKQPIETLQLQTEIKFSDYSLKKVELKSETARNERGDTKQSTNETNNTKSLSSLFKRHTVEQNTTLKLAGMFNGYQQGQSNQIKDVMATNEKRTSDRFRKNAGSNLVEALERLSSSGSSDEEMLNVGRTCQNKTTQQQNVSGKLQDETESLISILGDKHRKTTKNLEILDTLSQVIKEKSLKDENCMREEVYTEEMSDATESLEADQENAISNILVPGTKTKTGRRTTQKSENLVIKPDEITKALNEVEETTDANLQLQKQATKMKKTSKRQSKPKDVVDAVARVKNNEAPAPVQDVDADIREALGEIMSRNGFDDRKETTKPGATKTASKPKKRGTVSKKLEITVTSSEEVHDNSHREKAVDNGETPEQIAPKKRNPRKTQLQFKRPTSYRRANATENSSRVHQ